MADTLLSAIALYNLFITKNNLTHIKVYYQKNILKLKATKSKDIIIMVKA